MLRPMVSSGGRTLDNYSSTSLCVVAHRSLTGIVDSKIFVP